MQRRLILDWATGSMALLLALALILSGCMSLRHKVDPVSITLNVKLENVDPENQPDAKTGSGPGRTPP